MTDQERIQGAWQLTAGERGGKPFPEDVIQNGQLVFEGDRMTTRVKDRSTTFRFKLLAEQSPRAVDLDMDGTIGMGIYKLEGDTLTIVHTEAGQDRPKEFTTRPGTPLILMILKRRVDDASR